MFIFWVSFILSRLGFLVLFNEGKKRAMERVGWCADEEVQKNNRAKVLSDFLFFHLFYLFPIEFFLVETQAMAAAAAALTVFMHNC